MEQVAPEITMLKLAGLRPSPENRILYRPISATDPSIRALAADIRRHGILDALTVSADHYIISGHRRHVAARLAGLTEAPCRVDPIVRGDHPEAKTRSAFYSRLEAHNKQRVKTSAEAAREAIVSIDPERAYWNLINERMRLESSTGANVELLEIVGGKNRAGISDAKIPFLNAAIRVIADLRPFWPVSLRRVHYGLLNSPPLTNAGKPGSAYGNSLRCYKQLSDLLTRARLTGVVPPGCIADETRPVSLSAGCTGTGSFVKDAVERFLTGYRRNLQQSQPHHIEVLAEKMTLQSVLRPITSEHCLPLTIGRGYSSLPPRADLVSRYRASGKSFLYLLIVSDFDPDGEEICQSFARSIRDDFGVETVRTVRVALTREQVETLDLPPSMDAKPTSTNYQKFVVRNGGTTTYELEAVRPEELQSILREAIRSVMDVEAFNREIDAEKLDAAFLQGLRETIIGDLDLASIIDIEHADGENPD